MFRFEGQLTTIKPHAGYPCYRCLYPEPPPAGLVPNCQEAGVLGVLAGTMGILQASEAIKEILGIGETLADKLLIYDALEMKFRKVQSPERPGVLSAAQILASKISAPITPSVARYNVSDLTIPDRLSTTSSLTRATRSIRVLRILAGTDKTVTRLYRSRMW